MADGSRDEERTLMLGRNLDGLFLDQALSIATKERKLAPYPITAPPLLRPGCTVLKSELTVWQLRSHGMPHFTLILHM